jgi:hypothetical protein
LQWFILQILVFVCWSMMWACRDESQPPRAISGHSVSYQGISHGAPALRGERYCHLCHGTSLAGGDQFIPSCYTCHGKNWMDKDPEVDYAPASHMVNISGFFHKSGHANPERECVECHGAQLEGTGDSPSCLLCHGNLWDGVP